MITAEFCFWQCNGSSQKKCLGKEKRRPGQPSVPYTPWRKPTAMKKAKLGPAYKPHRLCPLGNPPPLLISFCKMRETCAHPRVVNARWKSLSIAYIKCPKATEKAAVLDTTATVTRSQDSVPGLLGTASGHSLCALALRFLAQLSPGNPPHPSSPKSWCYLLLIFLSLLLLLLSLGPIWIKENRNKS